MFFLFVSQLEGKRDKIDVEPIEREKIDLDMAAPTKLEKEEAPTDELEKKPYKHEPKEVTIDEVDATELLIPKVKVETNFKTIIFIITFIRF
jgi:predicted helicase